MAYPLYVKFDGTTYNLELRTSIETTGEERLIDVLNGDYTEILQKVMKIDLDRFCQGIELKTDGLNRNEEKTLTSLVNILKTLASSTRRLHNIERLAGERT